MKIIYEQYFIFDFMNIYLWKMLNSKPARKSKP